MSKAHWSEFIGKTFGEFGQVVVTGWSGDRIHRQKKFDVVCSICKEDAEMYGEGIFKVTKTQLERGHLPCGCAVSPQWTKRHYEVKVCRVCKEKGYILHGFHGDWKDGQTHLDLECKHDGNRWCTTTINSLVSAGKGCIVCSRKSRVNLITHTEEVATKGFMDSGAFLEGTKFWRIPREKSKPWYSYTCPACSVDTYVKAGVCSGVFTSSAEALTKGSPACRCSTKHRWTKDQREHQIKEILKQEGYEKLTFLGWEEGFKIINARLLMNCTEHGDYSISLNGFVNNRSKCRKCVNRGYNRESPGYVYVLVAKSESSFFTGYGITGKPKDRLGSHKTNLAKYGYKIDRGYIFPCLGKTAFDIESLIKSTFPVTPQECSGFRQEATHYELFEDVADFVMSSLANVSELPKGLAENFPDKQSFCMAS